MKQMRTLIVPDLCHDIMFDPHEVETQEVIEYIYNFIEKNNLAK